MINPHPEITTIAKKKKKKLAKKQNPCLELCRNNTCVNIVSVFVCLMSRSLNKLKLVYIYLELICIELP